MLTCCTAERACGPTSRISPMWRWTAFSAVLRTVGTLSTTDKTTSIGEQTGLRDKNLQPYHALFSTVNAGLRKTTARDDRYERHPASPQRYWRPPPSGVRFYTWQPRTRALLASSATAPKKNAPAPNSVAWAAVLGVGGCAAMACCIASRA